VLCVSKFNNDTLLTSLSSLSSLSQQQQQQERKKRERVARVLVCRFGKARRRFNARSSYAVCEREARERVSLSVFNLGFNIRVEFRVFLSFFGV